MVTSWATIQEEGPLDPSYNVYKDRVSNILDDVQYNLIIH